MIKKFYMVLVLVGVVLLLSNQIKAQSFEAEGDSIVQSLRGSLIPLQWAEKELSEISSIIPGEMYYQEDATESTFKQKVSEAGIIHLATHAIIDDDSPMHSKLVFTPDSSSDEDGFLNTYELYNMNLKANLVVLSACNTGYGKLVRGEGVMSLARGFTYAGCPSIVMSLWPVDDKSTYTLMKDFYLGITEGLKKDEALRQAKLNYIKNAKEPLASPFYWAGFTSLGNTEAIETRPVRSYIKWFVMAFFIITLFIFRKKILKPLSN